MLQNLATTLSILLLGVLSMQCTATFKTGAYCYRCCACIGKGSLKLMDNGRFDIEYERFNSPKDRYGKIHYGVGRYREHDGWLELEFDDLPAVDPAVRLTRIGDSENIDIKIETVFDPINKDTVNGANVKIRDAINKTKVYSEIGFNSGLDDRLSIDLRKNRMVNPALVFEASFIGYYTATVPIPGPGVYEATITLPVGYADVKFTSNDRKKLRIKNTLDGVVIRDPDDPKVYFTTKSCSCD